VPALLPPVLRKSAGAGALARVGAGAEDQDAIGCRSKRDGTAAGEAERHAHADLRSAVPNSQPSHRAPLNILEDRLNTLLALGKWRGLWSGQSPEPLPAVETIGGSSAPAGNPGEPFRPGDLRERPRPAKCLARLVRSPPARFGCWLLPTQRAIQTSPSDSPRGMMSLLTRHPVRGVERPPLAGPRWPVPTTHGPR
jgi:hypothetical protein